MALNIKDDNRQRESEIRDKLKLVEERLSKNESFIEQTSKQSDHLKKELEKLNSESSNLKRKLALIEKSSYIKNIILIGIGVILFIYIVIFSIGFSEYNQLKNESKKSSLVIDIQECFKSLTELSNISNSKNIGVNSETYARQRAHVLELINNLKANIQNNPLITKNFNAIHLYFDSVVLSIEGDENSYNLLNRARTICEKNNFLIEAFCQTINQGKEFKNKNKNHNSKDSENNSLFRRAWGLVGDAIFGGDKEENRQLSDLKQLK